MSVTTEPVTSSPTDSSSVTDAPSLPKRTPLYAAHRAAGAKLVDFSGWEMPVHYGSQIEEHHACRAHAVLFDVSHMTVIDLCDRQPVTSSAVQSSSESPYLSFQFLQRLLANDIARAKDPGNAIYSCLLNAAGGIIDDLIVYWLGEDRYRLVVNAGTRDRDLQWIEEQLPSQVKLTERDDLALLAIQGPKALELVQQVIATEALPGLVAKNLDLSNIPRFSAFENDALFIARTGYTGEDGFEIAVASEHAAEFWQALLDVGAKPAGLGARDTLRLESAMNLYGSDMDETVTPLESGIAWTVAWHPEERQFIGREALVLQRAKKNHKVMTGLVLEGRGVLRAGQSVCCNEQVVGEVTSGTFAPTVAKSIALARVEPKMTPGTACQVMIRNKAVAARVVQTPFVKNGESTIAEFSD